MKINKNSFYYQEEKNNLILKKKKPNGTFSCIVTENRSKTMCTALLLAPLVPPKGPAPLLRTCQTRPNQPSYDVPASVRSSALTCKSPDRVNP